MPERRYTTKARAKRINLDYFMQSHPLRRWRTVLSIGLPVVAAVWLAVYAVRGDHRLYTSGPVATAHAMFGTQCADCHAPAARAAGLAPSTAFFLPVSDRTCSVCHDGPVHHASQPHTPACASCHFEHKGRARLSGLAERECTQCHARLATKDGRPSTFAAHIAGFGSGHPEFAVNVPRVEGTARVRLDDTSPPRDAAQIKLNHAVHLKPALQGIDDVKARTGTLGVVERDGKPALGCTYCHRLDAQRVSMQPISFARHCMVCHPLDVDARLADAVAPHDTPALVHAYLRTTLIEAFEQCQALKTPSSDASGKLPKQCSDLGLVVAAAAPDEADAPRGRRLGRAPAETPPPDTPRRLGRAPADEPSDTPRRLGRAPDDAPPPDTPRRLGRPPSADESDADRPRGLRARGGDTDTTTPSAPASSASALDWAATQLGGMQKVMFRQKCEFCHILTQPGADLPLVAPTAIPARWLPHSVFDHGAHRSLTCTECHGHATKSTVTADVLLPSVSVCRECHREAGGARAACVECHLYHDKANDRDPDGPFTIRRLVRGAKPRAAGDAR